MKFWLILFFLLGLGAGYGGYWFYRQDQLPISQRNRVSDISEVTDGRGLRNPTDVPQGMLKYSGQYMTFTYPARAKKYPLKKADESVLERADFEIDHPRVSIVATAVEVTEKRLEEIPGVMARRSQKEKYREDRVVVGVEKNPVFTTLDGKEKVVFVIYHDRLHTLSIYGSDANEIKFWWQKIIPTFHFI